MKINRLFAGLLVAACFFSAGCSPMVREGEGHVSSISAQEKDGYYPISIETQNSSGEMVPQTFTKAPERVVCVWQNSIETLLALGVGDRIVAAMGLPSS